MHPLELNDYSQSQGYIHDFNWVDHEIRDSSAVHEIIVSNYKVVLITQVGIPSG